jgi:hypothetical protein
VGDGLLAGLSTYLASAANPEEGLYRWNGAALLAVITRNVPPDGIRREIGGLVAHMPQHEVTIGARTVMVPMSVGWAIFPVTRPVNKLFSQIDAFVESQSLAA